MWLIIGVDLLHCLVRNSIASFCSHFVITNYRLVALSSWEMYCLNIAQIISKTVHALILEFCHSLWSIIWYLMICNDCMDKYILKDLHLKTDQLFCVNSWDLLSIFVQIHRIIMAVDQLFWVDSIEIHSILLFIVFTINGSRFVVLCR